MSCIIAEPYWKKIWCKKKIAAIKEELEQAKRDGDAAKVAFYETELMILSVEDYVVH